MKVRFWGGLKVGTKFFIITVGVVLFMIIGFLLLTSGR